ncbi:hypothetical protein RhiirA5_421017 [Rhizophagus irregularis]|uniref:F-box domain-containing protein n=2 Tax=Rhizophagus irregularis TaxID=588596 RepID=A0A2I1E3K4_9GLOM|nr:hypothetical protein GLOIN_2v1772685 [Rhizophagus irregularis DAOM 181602=DAOM 197198]PKC05333.1 hypothetical protein RhiirA5_421017 [Rhizophagus irregularis]PKC65058.1 hypothetical protein RhiirA1_515433 [Rhizophagus irregularis]PKY16669.1 hypothetical protein RhiirB3_381927 [Rhizophagus irregularis]POG73258.1 hypothetical protein GLOIN_2v1772685 [Rhizophagus irregularis DAOM 181602=DAOM 197198]UZO02324.1 hypothetical protein OCT59_020807 [Rhizophagus irregularis]|eukprot:XP_025180124.1 hypothetical protein GLOIN_2v1772685 [Rhizophagus irregularis DAOM 181602=DAOM 197198]
MNSRIQLYPDCLRRIFEYIVDSSEYLHITHKNLYSCILVNKLFFQNAIPILWRNPWNPNSNKSKNNYNKKLSIARTILSCLLQYHREQQQDKNLTDIFGLISFENPMKDPIFDYVSYCRHINCLDIENVTRMLIENKRELNVIFDKKHEENIGYILFEEIWRLFMKKCNNIEYLKLPQNINISILPGSQQCLRWLNELECVVGNEMNQSINKNFIGLANICHNLTKIRINPLDKDDRGLATLIKAQNNLEEIHLFTNQHVENLRFINQALSTKSNSLEILSFKGNFYFSSQNSFLSSLHNLKQLHIKFATYSNINCLLNLTVLPKLEFFVIHLNYYSFEISLDCFSKLISTTKGLLRKFEIINATRPPSKIIGLQLFIQSIINHCPLINHLKIWYISDLLNDFKQLLISAEYLNSIEFDFLKVQNDENYDYNMERELQTKSLLDALIAWSSINLNYLYLSNLWWLLPHELSYFLELWKPRNIKLTLKIKDNEKEDLHPYLVVIDKFIKDDVLTVDSGKWIKEFPF